MLWEALIAANLILTAGLLYWVYALATHVAAWEDDTEDAQEHEAMSFAEWEASMARTIPPHEFEPIPEDFPYGTPGRLSPTSGLCNRCGYPKKREMHVKDGEAIAVANQDNHPSWSTES